MAKMEAHKKAAAGGSSFWDLDDGSGSWEPAKSREELRRRIDEIWDSRHDLEVEPSRGIKELIDSQDEFRARIEERLRRIRGG